MKLFASYRICARAALFDFAERLRVYTRRLHNSSTVAFYPHLLFLTF